MIEEHEKLNEPADFAAYKMRSIIDDLADQGLFDDAIAMQRALDLYLTGDKLLGFSEGMPFDADTGEWVV
jgi:hypothetical protein